MEIKTITYRLNCVEGFDHEVNKAIADGWTLVKREVLQPPAQPNEGKTYFHVMLYAELEKGRTEPREVELEKVNEVLRQETEILEGRLRHLLSSHFIASFDEVDPRTKEYIRDISLLDLKGGGLDQLLKRLEAPKKTRGCGNCKYLVTRNGGTIPPTSPCFLCFNGDKWEAAE